jgi:hypothetical protein
LVDGGRLLVWHTLRALADAGHEITLVAPVDPAGSDRAAAEQALRPLCRPVLVAARPASWVLAAARGLLSRQPASIVRHTHPAVRDEVARLLVTERFDVVHAEQVHALAQCEPAFAAGVRVVWRAQNVESDLWSAWAEVAGLLRPLLRREARMMAAAEADAVRRTAATIALTHPDAERLGALSGLPKRIQHVPAPFPAELPPADHPLPGSPAVVLFASTGWRPNEEGARWFLRDVWPQVLTLLPEAQLHVFGGSVPSGRSLVLHPAPADSRDAFAPGSVLAVPLRVASGVRMKILEAWARGVAVVATPQAMAGMGADPAARIGDDPSSLARAIADASHHLTEGRGLLRSEHDPALVAAALCWVFAGAPRSGL